MKKTITMIALILLVFSSKAQETFVVRGYLDSPKNEVSINFHKNMFCYLNGDFIISKRSEFMSIGYYFYTFKVDSVISGLFMDFDNEVSKPPFNIMVGLINECIILDCQQDYTLRIKQFPNTNYYYIDSLSQVFPNEKYSNKLTEYHKDYQQNIDILTKGSLQERHDFLDKIRIYDYTDKYKDYRYIQYIIPYMASQDSIINYEYTSWDGIDENGKGIGGTYKYEVKGLYSEYLYEYLDYLVPFKLPEKTTDSIGWYKWYESFFSKKDCFPLVKYAKSQHKEIINADLFNFCLFDRNIFGVSTNIIIAETTFTT